MKASPTHLLIMTATIRGTMYDNPPVNSNIMTTRETDKQMVKLVSVDLKSNKWNKTMRKGVFLLLPKMTYFISKTTSGFSTFALALAPTQPLPSSPWPMILERLLNVKKWYQAVDRMLSLIPTKGLISFFLLILAKYRIAYQSFLWLLPVLLPHQP